MKTTHPRIDYLLTIGILTKALEDVLNTVGDLENYGMSKERAVFITNEVKKQKNFLDHIYGKSGD